MRRLTLLVIASAGCARSPVGARDTDDDRPSGVDLGEPDVDRDTGSPKGGERPAESDVDTSLPEVVDTDVPPLDSSWRDTWRPADSGEDSGLPVPGLTVTTVPQIHLNLHVPGQLLEVGPLVVTATRLLSSPPATNGFAAQVPGANRPGNGIYVDLRDGQGLPSVDDLVVVRGVYTEWPSHAHVPTQTMSRLVVHPSIPGTLVAVVGRASPAAPLVVHPLDVVDPATAEDLEGMLVRVEAGAALVVQDAPSRTWNEFRIGVSGSDAFVVDPWFDDVTTTLGVVPGAWTDSVTGVLLYEPWAHKLAPRDADDLPGWTLP